MLMIIYARRVFSWININNLLVAILSIIIYDYIFQQYLYTFISTSNKPEAERKTIYNLTSSSIWCRGENLNRRLCRFRNLCINPDGEFIFLHGAESIISGVHSSKIKEPVVELSSVEGHNALTLTLTDVPLDKIGVLQWRIREIETPSFILKRFKPNNLMHVIHDDLMPVFSTLNEIGACHENDTCHAKLVFVDLFPAGPFWDIYKLFSKFEPLLLSTISRQEIYCFKEAYVGVNRNTVWYQYGFSIPQSPWPNRTVNAIDVRRFTSYMVKSLEGNLIPSSCATASINIVLSRKNTRLILNERQIAEIIRQRTNNPVTILSLDDHSLVDLIAHVRCAKILVGMHGALLVLAAFLPPHSILIELFPYTVPPEDYTPYKTLATLPAMGITYKAWVNKRKDHTVTHPDWPKQLGGLGHLSNELQQKIQSDQSVKPHLCCNDPHWLFRIYQDTFVDIESFDQVIQEALEENSVTSQVRYEDELYHLWSVNLLPGRVNYLTCVVENEDVVLSWTPPWNLKLLGMEEVVYEVWFQIPNEAHYKLVVTNTTMQIIKKYGLPFDVWVRCQVYKELRGPFQWIECKED